MKVLVVEDSVEVRARVLRLLGAVGRIEVVGAASSNEEAVALFERLSPELVTLDVSLRDGGSLGTLRRMMSSTTPPIVIVLTDHASPHYRERYLAAGARHYLQKSEMEQLEDLIRGLLETE